MSNFPEGYHIENTSLWGDLLVGNDRKESFRLTDRPFESEINHYLGYLPSQILNYLLQNNPDRVIQVLDGGGGRLSASSAEIARVYGSRVDVTNLELMPAEVVPPGVRYITGNVCNMLQIETGSIDFAYSYQVLTNFEEGDQKQIQALAEFARVLRPGGVALVPDKYFSGMPLFDSRFTQFGIEHNVVVIGKYGNSSQKGRAVFGGPWRFPMIAKEPVNYNLLYMQSQIIGHY